MKKVIFISIFVFFALNINAQSKDKDKNTGKATEATISQQDELLLYVKQDLQNQKDTVSKRNAQIIELNNTIVSLKNKIVQDSIEHVKEKNTLLSQIKSKEDEIDKLNNQNSDLQKDVESNKTSSDKLTERVFQQCLLYPLDIKYDKTNIEDALNCLTDFDLSGNPNYKKWYEIYEPMLNGYKDYNQELRKFLERQQTRLKALNWNISDGTKSEIKASLGKLSYYVKYKNRDNAPFQSIRYLDNVINDFIDIIEEKSIDDVRFDHLLKKLPAISESADKQNTK